MQCFSIPCVSFDLSPHTSVVTVSKCLTGEKEIKADCIIQQRLSFSNKVKYSALLKCPVADKNHGAQQCLNRSI